LTVTFDVLASDCEWGAVGQDNVGSVGIMLRVAQEDASPVGVRNPYYRGRGGDRGSCRRCSRGRGKVYLAAEEPSP
jgi:hypothetical protein